MIRQNTKFPLLLDPLGKSDHQAIHCSTANFGLLSRDSITSAILWLFPACDSRKYEPGLFKKYFQILYNFAQVLPIFSQVLPFFAVFLKNHTHTLTFQNRPWCLILILPQGHLFWIVQLFLFVFVFTNLKKKIFIFKYLQH